MNGSRSGFWTYALIVATAAGLLWWLSAAGPADETWMNTAISPDDTQQIIFDVEVGSSGKTIAKNLEKEGFIVSDRPFYGYLKEHDLGGNLQAGRFVLRRSMTPLEIIDALTSGAGQLAVTIPEGFTLDQIQKRLTKLGLDEESSNDVNSVNSVNGVHENFMNCVTTCPLAERWDFLKDASSLEGYLFPDTFFVDPASYTQEGFLHRLLGNFETKFLTPENRTAIAKSGHTLDDIVIMASIVEREAFLDEDYPVIAGILWKRLDNGWPLDADATLLYVLDDPSDLAANLDLDSPYNSRKNRGLPPTAISNPGLTALQAALYPEDSSYWFYLNDQDTGKAHFAVTNEEHNANKAKWLQ